MALSPGEEFAGYVIQRLLGSGGMGEVYLARHPRLPRLDALKILPTGFTSDAEYRKRFNREADLAAELWHPHIVGVHDRGEHDGRLWISMDYVDGTDARQLLKDRYPSGMPVQEVMKIVTAVADALDFAHRRQLLHRDVKPANILLTEPTGGDKQRILLADFGIARRIEDSSDLTATNMTVGSIAYAAPEQLMGNRRIDGRADQYALAVTTFTLLTGTTLYPFSNPAVVMANQLNSPPPSLADRKPELAHFDPALSIALRKDPQARYPHCAGLVRALDGALANPTRSISKRSGSTRSLASCEPDSPSTSGPPNPTTTRLSALPLKSPVARAVDGPTSSKDEFRAPVPAAPKSEPPGPEQALAPTKSSAPDEARPPKKVAAIEASHADKQTSVPTPIANASRADTMPPQAPPKRSPVVPTPPSRPANGAPFKRAARIVLVAILAGGAALLGGVALWVLVRPHSLTVAYIVVKPTAIDVFPRDDKAETAHQSEIRNAVDGDRGTVWLTDAYRAEPFPDYKPGVGLLLTLPAPTVISAVDVEIASVGTAVQIRSSSGPPPKTLAATTQLSQPRVLQSYHRTRIAIEENRPASTILMWISTLGTFNGNHQAAITEITLFAKP